MSERENLTPEELTDLSKLHLAAMDLYRNNCNTEGVVPACWLAMSDEAKAEQVQKLIEFFSQRMGRPLDLLDVTMICGDLPDEKLHQWQEAEAVYKRLREEGNPRAYFVG